MTIERAGLGYSLLVAKQGVGLNIDRLVESREGLSGELTVAQAPKGHLFRGRFNVTSLSARKTTAGYLQSIASLNGKGPPWTEILETFCVAVLDAEREGAPVTTIGERRPRTRPRFLLEPLILDGPVPTILYGLGGAGKSTLAAAAAVSISSGVAAYAGWTVIRRTEVLVLDYETSDEDWNENVVALADGLGIDPPRIKYQECALPLHHIIHEVTRTVSDAGIGFVIIDSAGQAMPTAREGTSAEDGAIRLFKAIRLLGVPTLVIDHKAKDDRNRGPYGSVYKWNSARAVWELDADDEGSRLTLIHRKHNLTPRYPAAGIRLSRSDEHILLIRDEPDESVPGAVTIASRIEAVLRDSPYALSIATIAERTEKDARTVARTLNRSDRFTRVRIEGRHQMWALVDNSGGQTVDMASLVHQGEPPSSTPDGLGGLGGQPGPEGPYYVGGTSLSTDLSPLIDTRAEPFESVMEEEGR